MYRRCNDRLPRNVQTCPVVFCLVFFANDRAGGKSGAKAERTLQMHMTRDAPPMTPHCLVATLAGSATATKVSNSWLVSTPSTFSTRRM